MTVDDFCEALTRLDAHLYELKPYTKGQVEGWVCEITYRYLTPRLRSPSQDSYRSWAKTPSRACQAVIDKLTAFRIKTSDG